MGRRLLPALLPPPIHFVRSSGNSPGRGKETVIFNV